MADEVVKYSTPTSSKVVESREDVESTGYGDGNLESVMPSREVPAAYRIAGSCICA